MNDPLNVLRAALNRPAPASSDFDLNPGTVLPEGRILKPAAVLIAVDLARGDARLWLTKRSSALQHHPGQIAFPGGKVDATDDGVVAAALRESHEEIGLDPVLVDVLGTLPAHETVTGYTITPVLGIVRRAFTPRPEPGEVDEAFAVPLDHVLNPALYSVQSRRWRGQRRHYYTVPYGPYYIWGATARMLRALAEMTRG
jgi:8-oxo-dGTP pyrophosphatase MutT (NUDIX family)